MSKSFCRPAGDGAIIQLSSMYTRWFIKWPFTEQPIFALLRIWLKPSIYKLKNTGTIIPHWHTPLVLLNVLERVLPQWTQNIWKEYQNTNNLIIIIGIPMSISLWNCSQWFNLPKAFNIFITIASKHRITSAAYL